MRRTDDLKKKFISLASYINRSLRYGNSTNKLFQFLVIRTRYYLKQYLNKNLETINTIGTVKIKIKHAGLMELRTSDYVDRWLYTGADFEPHVVSLFLTYLSPTNNVIDIGANIGYFSLIAAKLIGPIGKVYSFEPSPLTCKKLRRNIELNGLRNIDVVQKAAFNKVGVEVFRIPSDEVRNSGRSSFREIEENSLQIDVDTITLDSILPALSTIHLIKMDIEGAEAMALEGMVDLIKRDHPFFIMELSDKYLRQLGSSGKFVIDFFRRYDYKIYLANEGLKEIDDKTRLDEDQYDIFCVPRSKAIIK
ncbi:FkbM family methyltransferase [Segetibacter sp.]|jgi:FkbM family methyltransferase|uniref:FkbM family methyltransferase n=1 Tax=Segetibacter sp. TaxID=2231182 RepID=UPI002602991D|nr:FkbM family methyltransferase [Segetibacter sp.]MCW3079607.1 methyltransferase FkbM family [Segetibacter sp.]